MAYGLSDGHVTDDVKVTGAKGVVRQYGRQSWRQLGF